jgi:hypothetical protein
MAKRHKDALLIQAGACNPSGIAHSIIEACREIREEPAAAGTDQIRNDPAIRLMVHQLAYLCNARGVDDLDTYGELTRECEAMAGN